VASTTEIGDDELEEFSVVFKLSEEQTTSLSVDDVRLVTYSGFS